MGPLNVTGWTAGPPADESRWLRAEGESAAAGARREATAQAEPLGFAAGRLGEVQLAATEAAMNLARHAERGEMVVRTVRAGEARALEIISIDHGPGMADVSRSRLGGHSTGGSLGIGLGAIERLADHSGLYSLPRIGTTHFARFLPPDEPAATSPPPPGTPAPGASPSGAHASGASSFGALAAGARVAGLTRPIDGERECGDAYAAFLAGGTVYAMLCDGLGHGPMAARAARAAVRAMSEVTPPARPAEILERIHRELRPTRGGTVAVAAIDTGAGRVRFCGVGNISAWVLHESGRTGMASVPGIAGDHARTREHDYDLPPGAAVVLHSDGLTDRWDPAAHPGLAGRDPLLIAATLIRDAGTRHDDRAVLAVTTSGPG